MTNPETEEVEAEVVLWRVFGLNDTFPDLAPPDWRAEEERGPKAGDQARIMLGELPGDLIEALKRWRAQASGILGTIFGRTVKDDVDRLALYERDFEAITLHEFDEPYPTWLSIRISRGMRVTAKRGVWLSWIAEMADFNSALSDFEADGNRYLDGAIARMIAALGSTNLATMRYGDRRPMITDRSEVLPFSMIIHSHVVASPASSTERACRWPPRGIAGQSPHRPDAQVRNSRHLEALAALLQPRSVHRFRRQERARSPRDRQTVSLRRSCLRRRRRNL